MRVVVFDEPILDGGQVVSGGDAINALFEVVGREDGALDRATASRFTVLEHLGVEPMRTEALPETNAVIRAHQERMRHRLATAEEA